ncbi:MAG TPA: histidine kinase [Candidatus Sulfopaludibacter sp.]|nr:histidine kinase [Candidatus Sulfopaludibacter sp.]
MHPVLSSRRRLLFYLLAWTPLVGLLGYVVWASGGISWPEALGVLAPACLVYAFTCLSPWYLCRAMPLRLTRAFNLAATWAVCAVAGSLVFVVSARLAASFVGEFGPLAGVERHLTPHQPLLFGMGVLLYLCSAGLNYAAVAAEQSHQAERRAVESRALAREAELQALRMQINPHFLFNSLHSIAALTSVDGGRAREMCVRLADFLRAGLALGERERIPLREELALARGYLEVEQVRFGERLRVEESIEAACEECAVPALLLQPLVENAVKHGIAGLLEGGAIRLTAQRTPRGVEILLENEFDPEMPPPRKSGLGLAHVRRRLELRYGDEASFDAAGQGGVYRVLLRLPCESSMASNSRA